MVTEMEKPAKNNRKSQEQVLKDLLGKLMAMCRRLYPYRDVMIQPKPNTDQKGRLGFWVYQIWTIPKINGTNWQLVQEGYLDTIRRYTYSELEMHQTRKEAVALRDGSSIPV